MKTFLAKIRIVLKPGVLDTQGEAVRNGLTVLGFGSVEDVRVGKWIEVRLRAGDSAAAYREADDMCRRLLANPVIEHYTLDVEDYREKENRQSSGVHGGEAG